MATNIAKFNKIFDEFLCKLINNFDYDKLKKYRRYFLIISKTQEELPANLFMVGCISYKDKLSKRDETFFTNSEEINEKAKIFGNFTEDSGLKHYWAELNPETKKNVWDYLQTLFVLAEMIIKKNTKIFDKLNSLYLKDYKDDVKNLHDKFSLDFLLKLNS